MRKEFHTSVLRINKTNTTEPRADYSLLLLQKKNELKTYRAAEEILFLERFP